MLTAGIHFYGIPHPKYRITFCLILSLLRGHLKDTTVLTCPCFCGCACWRQRGSLVCRPQIYGALTLGEESTFSAPARNTDKGNGSHAVLLFILTSHSFPLMYFTSYHPHIFLSVKLLSDFFPPSQSQSSWIRPVLCSCKWTKVKAVTMLPLEMPTGPCQCNPIQGRGEAGVCLSMLWCKLHFYTDQHAASQSVWKKKKQLNMSLFL